MYDAFSDFERRAMEDHVCRLNRSFWHSKEGIRLLDVNFKPSRGVADGMRNEHRIQGVTFASLVFVRF